MANIFQTFWLETLRYLKPFVSVSMRDILCLTFWVLAFIFSIWNLSNSMSKDAIDVSSCFILFSVFCNDSSGLYWRSFSISSTATDVLLNFWDASLIFFIDSFSNEDLLASSSTSSLLPFSSVSLFKAAILWASLSLSLLCKNGIIHNLWFSKFMKNIELLLWFPIIW